MLWLLQQQSKFSTVNHLEFQSGNIHLREESRQMFLGTEFCVVFWWIMTSQNGALGVLFLHDHSRSPAKVSIFLLNKLNFSWFCTKNCHSPSDHLQLENTVCGIILWYFTNVLIRPWSWSLALYRWAWTGLNLFIYLFFLLSRLKKNQNE